MKIEENNIKPTFITRKNKNNLNLVAPPFNVQLKSVPSQTKKFDECFRLYSMFILLYFRLLQLFLGMIWHRLPVIIFIFQQVIFIFFSVFEKHKQFLYFYVGCYFLFN